ncbi:MAG: hypothetical protein AAF959_02470, partial [Cyanobacteria bacterium P01_D01_bin.56]
IELISCAKTTADSNAAIAAANCGYGSDVQRFRTELKAACAEMGVEIDGLADLMTERQQIVQTGGIEISPDSMDEL